MTDSDRIAYVGHGTVLVEVDGTRLLTDPVLGRWVGPLVRHGPMPGSTITDDLDAVLISHLHRDHADLPSLRKLGRETLLLVPAGSRRFFARRGFAEVTELRPGESAAVGRLTVTAVEANHEGGSRRRAENPEAIGFLIGGRRRIYFAGDTDLYPGIGEIEAELDLALLPVWGWGPSLGPGTSTRSGRRGWPPSSRRGWRCRFTGAPSIRSASLVCVPPPYASPGGRSPS